MSNKHDSRSLIRQDRKHARRELLKLSGAGLGLAGLGLMSGRSEAWAAQLPPKAQTAVGDGPGGRLRITDVKAILTQPSVRQAVVKIETNEPGLYGVGCATFTQRIGLVRHAVDDYLRPFLIGKDPTRIEDIWQSNFVSSYWRNGPVLMNALSGADSALWDILGKRAGLPVYQLLGGKTREGTLCYINVQAPNNQAVVQGVRQAMAQGFKVVRIQISTPGGYGSGGLRKAETGGPQPPVNARTHVYNPREYALAVPRMFEYVRKAVGDSVELLHDVHERLPPILAIQLCRDVERFRPFFIEDPFAPEDNGYFKILRQQTSTPIAMGELFNNPNEYVDLISGRLIDFIRCHVSQIGGLSMARKIAAFGEFFNVRTAWHGPADTSPVGHAAQIHLGMATTNFGVQEARLFNDPEREVYPGCPELRNGYFQLSDRPGLGIDVDEKAAAKYPINNDPPFDMNWGNYRREDGSIVKP